jgi:hypothetical protein
MKGRPPGAASEARRASSVRACGETGGGEGDDEDDGGGESLLAARQGRAGGGRRSGRRSVVSGGVSGVARQGAAQRSAIKACRAQRGADAEAPGAKRACARASEGRL